MVTVEGNRLQLGKMQKWSILVEWGFLGGTVVRNFPANARHKKDMGLIPGLGRSPRKGNGNPLQYSYLENSMDRGAMGSQKSWTRFND